MAYKLATAFVDIVTRGVDSFDRVVSGIGSNLAGLAGTLAGSLGIPLGIGAAIASAYHFIAGAEQAYDAEARLRAIVAATGMAAKRSADDILAMAASMQKLTQFDDEAIVNASAKLLTFKKVVGTTFDRAMKLAADLAATGFGSIEGAALQLGKALEDPVRGLGALRRSGVSFSEQEKKMISQLVKSGQLLKAQGMILDAVAGQVAGVAEAMGKTPAGQWKQLKNLIGDVGEELGKRLLPIALAVGKVFLTWAEGAMKQLDAMIRLGAAIRDQVWGALQPILAWITGKTGISFDWLKGGFVNAVQEMIKAWFEFTADTIEWVQVFVEHFGTAMQAVMQGAAFLASYMLDLYRDNATYIWGYFAGRAMRAIADLAVWIADVLYRAFTGLANALVALFESIPQLIQAAISGTPGALEQMGQSMMDGFNAAFKEAIYQINRAEEGFEDGFNKTMKGLKLDPSDANKKRLEEFNKLFGKLQKAKDDLEATRGDMFKLPDLGLKMAKPPEPDAGAKPLDIKGGLSGLTESWKTLQEAMLKRDSPQEKMAKGIENIDKAQDNLLEELVTINRDGIKLKDVGVA